METVKFNVTAEEAVFIYNVLGQLPTQSNAHPLYMKLGSQIQSQAPKSLNPNTSENEDLGYTEVPN